MRHRGNNGSDVMDTRMQPFLDSTDLMDDGPALAERLRRDGYLFLRGLFPRKAIMTVRERLLEKARDGGWLDTSAPLALERGVVRPERACKDPEERYMEVFRPMWRDEELHRLRIRPEPMGLFERIFEETPLVHPMFVQRNIFPQSQDFDFTTGIHQDRVHIGGATNQALWVPLGDCPLEKGPLAVASGSHRKGVLDTKVGNGAGGMDICETIPGTWVCGGFEAGDALVFTDVTVHQALPNLTGELRQSFDARYQPASQPVADKSLEPYPGLGDWASVYEDWSSAEGQYYWRDLDLEVVPLNREYYDRRDEMAFAMAERGELEARDALLRIIQRDPDPGKRARAEALLPALETAAH